MRKWLRAGFPKGVTKINRQSGICPVPRLLFLWPPRFHSPSIESVRRISALSDIAHPAPEKIFRIWVLARQHFFAPPIVILSESNLSIDIVDMRTPILPLRLSTHCRPIPICSYSSISYNPNLPDDGSFPISPLSMFASNSDSSRHRRLLHPLWTVSVLLWNLASLWIHILWNSLTHWGLSLLYRLLFLLLCRSRTSTVVLVAAPHSLGVHFHSMVPLLCHLLLP